MSSSINQIEKLIQIVAIDQLHAMLKNLNISNINSDSPVPATQKTENTSSCNCDCNKVNDAIHDIYNSLNRIEKQLALLSEKMDIMETDDRQVHVKVENDATQMKLTNYSGFASKNKNEEHVVLEVEEIVKVKAEPNVIEVEEDEEEEEEEQEEEEEEEEEEEQESIITENAIETEVVEVGSKKEEEEVEEEEVEEEEVEEEEVEEEEVEEEEVEEEVEEEEKEEEEEEEEVFEIEIDDVTYYATSEENGILYEVDKDGDVGKKVGIIKDGEVIFS